MLNKKAALALLLTLAFTLTACTLQDLPVIGKYLGGLPSNGPVTLTMWGLWEKPEVMATLITNYQKAHPNVKINYEDRSVLNPDDYKARVFGQASQSLDADIVMVHDSWIPALKTALTPMPAKLMSTSDFSSTFYPVATDTSIADGKIYGLPYYYDGLVLVYNKDDFDSVGETAPPTVWEEFRRLALTLTTRSGEQGETIVRAGAAIGAADNIDHFSDILGLMLSQAGVNFPTDIDSKPAQDALAFYTNFLKEDKVWDPTFPEASAAFAQGKVSMIIVPTWQVLDILTANPSMNIGVAPVPQALPDKPVTWASYWLPVVPSTSKNSAAAWDFINYLVQEQQQMTLFSDASKVRPFGPAYSRASLATQLQSNAYLKPLVDTAPYAKSSTAAGRSGNKKEVDALKTAVDAVLSGATPADALKTAKEAITK